jgi:dienelactone hydrolase
MALAAPGVTHAQDATPSTPAASAPQPEDTTPPGVGLEASLFETVVKVPVTVQPMFGDARQGEIIVTHFKPRGDGPFPLVVMNHGRSSKDRANPRRARYLDIAHYWTRRGAAVIVPTRLGYGDTGLEPDPEETGPCDRKRYDVAARNMNVQLQAVLDFAVRQPWIDAKRIIVMGQSMGGFATVAYMGQKHPGVIAGINFAGGGGGDTEQRKANPCRYDQLAKIFEEAGKANAGTTPMLWLYSRNDLYWGENIPRQWHEAYTAAGGGKARFEMLPAVGDDGHRLIAIGRQYWRPIVDAFVEPLGLRAPKSVGAPSATPFAAIDDTGKLPHVRQETKDVGYRRFLNADLPRAFAIGPKGEWAFISGDDAMKRALERCAQTAKGDCRLYAVDDAVVWAE